MQLDLPYREFFKSKIYVIMCALLYKQGFRPVDFDGVVPAESKAAAQAQFDEAFAKIPPGLLPELEKLLPDERVRAFVQTRAFDPFEYSRERLLDAFRDIIYKSKILEVCDKIIASNKVRIGCEGLTIFANVDTIQAPVPYSVNVEGVDIRVRTVRKDAMELIANKLESYHFPFPWKYTLSRLSESAYIILLCDESNGILDLKGYKVISERPSEIWNVSGGLGNTSGIPGVGSLLMKATQALAIANRVPYISISTVEAAYDFYKKIGFEGEPGRLMMKPTGFTGRSI